MIRDIQTNDDGVILDIGGHAFPLLAKHVFIGAGANAFMLDYPQYDYIYHAYVTGQNSYDVKAHCWYLQQWVENGLIGLLLLIGFLGCYVVRSTRIYRKADLKESITWIGVGLFAGIMVYLTAAIANDSNVCTSPLFWGMLGLGMAVNRIVVNKESLFAEPEAAVEEAEAAKPQAVSQPAKKNSGKKLSKKKRKQQKKA